MMRNRYNEDNRCRPADKPCHEPHNIGNGKNILVNIKSVNGTPMDELYFVLHFRVYGSHEEMVLSKQQLYTAKGKYYALLNDRYFNEGWLMCDIEVFEPMPGWPNGMKPSTLRCCTELMIGNCYGMPYPMDGCMMPNSKGYVNGFKVSFKEVDDLPEVDEDEDEGSTGDDNNGGNDEGTQTPTPDEPATSTVDIRYGVIRGLSAFGSITDAQLAGLTALSAKPSGVVNVPVTVGDTLVVLCDGATAMKGDGIGGKTTFDTSIMGANGESVTVGGKTYKAYGETFLVSGTIEVYII